ncbi:ANK2, partial [Symbiodinium sp. KB8]
MERFMRAVPFWQPLQEKEILPTAESDLEDEMMGKRWRDAVVGALLLIGVAVAMAQFFAFVGNLVAQRTASKKPVASSSNASVLIVNEGPSETRPMLKAPEEESVGILAGFYEYELSLGLGKSAILLARGLGPDVVVHDEQPDAGSFLEEKRLVQPKPCSSGARELLQAVLAVDVLGYLGRAIQAAWIGRKVPSPAMPMIMSARVDLLKDAAAGAGSLKPVVAEGTAYLRLPYCSWPPVRKTIELNNG